MDVAPASLRVACSGYPYIGALACVSSCCNLQNPDLNGSFLDVLYPCAVEPHHCLKSNTADRKEDDDEPRKPKLIYSVTYGADADSYSSRASSARRTMRFGSRTK